MHIMVPNTSNPGRRRLAFAFVFPAILFLAGFAASCSSIGSGLVDGIHSKRDKLAETVRPVSRAAIEELGRAFEDSLRPRLEAAVGAITDDLHPLLDSLEFRVKCLEESLAVFISGPADTAIQILLADIINLARDSIDYALSQWVSTVACSLDAQFKPAMANAASHVAAVALDSLAGKVDSTGSVGRAVVGLGDRVVRQAVKAIAEESQRKTPWWVWLVAAIFTIVALSVIGRFILSLRREILRSRTSLRLVTRAIQEKNDMNLSRRVKTLALEHGMEPWLNTFLTEEHLLAAGEPKTEG